MRSAKKLLALLLATVMLLTLCACGKKELSNDDLNGEWTLTFIPSAMGLDQTFNFEGFSAKGSITTKAVIRDGKMEIYTDGITTWAQQLAGDLYDWIHQDDNVFVFMAAASSMSVDDYTAECDGAGITKEMLLSELEKQITKEALAEAVLDSFGDAETLTHNFEIKNGELCFDEGAVWAVTVSKNKIAVNEIKSEDSTRTLKDGDMVFTR